MSTLHDLVNRAVSYGMVGGMVYSATKCVSAYELAQALEADRKERAELITAIIKLSDKQPCESSKWWHWEEFFNALRDAEALVDSIPHPIRYEEQRAKHWQDLDAEEFNSLKACGMLWEFYPDAHTNFPT